jgi:hypothetical protein
MKTFTLACEKADKSCHKLCVATTSVDKQRMSKTFIQQKDGKKMKKTKSLKDTFLVNGDKLLYIEIFSRI